MTAPTMSARCCGVRWLAGLVGGGAVQVLGTRPVWADGAPTDRPVTWYDWNPDIVFMLGLVLVGWLYARGLAALWRKAGPGEVVSSYQAAAFAVGLAVLVVALISPLDLLSEQLAAAHMVQHMLVMVVAAPLLVVGAPWLVCLWGFSPTSRRALGRVWARWGWARQVWRVGWNPVAVWAGYAAVTWCWHLPWLYDAAVRHLWVHDLQHLSFLASACLFWRLLFDPLGRLCLPPGLGVLFLFTTTLHTTVLGVLMTLAPSPWYSVYAQTTTLWELSPLEDQQLAGLIMWMPSCLPYVVAAIYLLVDCLENRSSVPSDIEVVGEG